MEGYVAVTDPGWYEFLKEGAESGDANFWRPSARAFRLPVGTPFFFKLKAPHHAIAGFGRFAGFTVLPDWLAWETFGEANGVAGLAALRTRLTRIQTGARIEPDAAGRIGCCLIAESTFFSRDDWVEPPRGWKRHTQTGAKYDLARGEGLRVWKDCLDRAANRVDVFEVREDPMRYGTSRLSAPRLGQGIFRVHVLDAYQRACAVTREHSLPVLEAAHIKAYAAGGEHRVSNGLSLRSDLHRLFDRGYVTVDDDYRFVVSDRLRLDFDNGRSYWAMHGQRLELPRDRNLLPDRASLEWHRDEVYLG